jgi:hypothetical protein
MTSSQNNNVYAEQVSSARTQALFAFLMLLGLLFFIWRLNDHGLDAWSVLGLAVFAMFLFYMLNYRTLLIQLTADSLCLTFGLVSWLIPLNNIETCYPEDISLWRIGGAGIHFTSIDGRYRAMFNFLEYPRVVVALKVKRGPVRDVVFSTRRPDEIVRLIQEGVARGGDRPSGQIAATTP